MLLRSSRLPSATSSARRLPSRSKHQAVSREKSASSRLFQPRLIVVLMQLYNDYLNKNDERALAGIGEVEREELRGKTAFADRTDRRNVFFKYTH